MRNNVCTIIVMANLGGEKKRDVVVKVEKEIVRDMEVDVEFRVKDRVEYI